MWRAVAALACGALLALAQHACTHVRSGYLTGPPHQLPATYLTPGLADWTVAVPLPAECRGGQAAGQEALVCDGDARPSVRTERGAPAALRVRRTGWLLGYATVQLTLYCIFPYPLKAPDTMANMLPALPNRFQTMTESAPPPPSFPTIQQVNELVASILTTPSPEQSSSFSMVDESMAKSEEELKQDSMAEWEQGLKEELEEQSKEESEQGLEEELEQDSMAELREELKEELKKESLEELEKSKKGLEEQLEEESADESEEELEDKSEEESEEESEEGSKEESEEASEEESEESEEASKDSRRVPQCKPL